MGGEVERCDGTACRAKAYSDSVRLDFLETLVGSNPARYGGVILRERTDGGLCLYETSNEHWGLQRTVREAIDIELDGVLAAKDLT